jgi:2-oxoglutarate ferredoxin oxidoreductase subunit beta
VEAIEHPGFSFVQALSPCKTFRPEQMEWKKHVRAFADEPTDDPGLAAERVYADDGMSTGIIYRRSFPVYQPGGDGRVDPQQFDREFAI